MRETTEREGGSGAVSDCVRERESQRERVGGRGSNKRARGEGEGVGNDRHSRNG